MRRTSHPDHLTLLARQATFYVRTNAPWSSAMDLRIVTGLAHQQTPLQVQKFRIAIHSVLVAKAKHEQCTRTAENRKALFVRWPLQGGSLTLPAKNTSYYYADHITPNPSSLASAKEPRAHTDRNHMQRGRVFLLHASRFASCCDWGTFCRFFLWCCAGGDVIQKGLLLGWPPRTLALPRDGQVNREFRNVVSTMVSSPFFFLVFGRNKRKSWPPLSLRRFVKKENLYY
jgi:hypothetical protein